MRLVNSVSPPIGPIRRKTRARAKKATATLLLPTWKSFPWLRQILRRQSELKDPDEFLEAVKVDLFDEEIFVFTPKGDVFSLPKNATALDFAFSVHTDVGVKCIGVKVNGRMAPIKRRFKLR